MSWLSIDVLLGNEPYGSNFFLEFDFLRKREKSVANSWESEKVVGESPEGRT